MKAIVIATKGSRSLPVFLASVNAYVPNDVVVYLAGDERWGIGRHIRCIPNLASNYGDAYNSIVHEAFKYHDEIIVANDDIVLTPTSYEQLVQDVETLKTEHSKIGWVVARADYVRPMQLAHGLNSTSIYKCDQVSPLFGYVSKEAWVDYAPINWYSDDIQCLEMKSIGYQHFISRSYVHHAGSQTIGMDHNKNHLEAQPWIKKHKPELHRVWYEEV
jgi:hypothetical protein